MRSGQEPEPDEPAELRGGRVGLVNPLLECPDGERLRRPLEPFEHRLDALVAEKERAGLVRRASVYLRDLNNGPWLGTGEGDEYRIASLLKVPLLLGYLKRAETEPDILSDRLEFTGGTPMPQDIEPREHLQPGQSYTVEELLERAIVESDNDAAALLAAADGGRSLDGVRALAQFPPFRDGNLFLTPRHFATMLRVLYNASYLNQAMSEKALELLTRTEFRDGIVAGVPAGTVVAHKFGESRFDDRVELHDCGIVYYPQQPYVLCVMTEGHDLRQLAQTIAEISRDVWAEVDAQARRGSRAPG